MKRVCRNRWIKGTGNVIYLLPASNTSLVRMLEFVKQTEFFLTQNQARLPLLSVNSSTLQEPTSNSGNSMDQ